MATIHISEAEAANDFSGLMARARAGDEIVIEDASSPAVKLSAVHGQPGLMLSASIISAEARGSAATLDGDFARDLEAVIASRREPLNPPAWD